MVLLREKKQGVVTGWTDSKKRLTAHFPKCLALDVEARVGNYLAVGLDAIFWARSSFFHPSSGG